MRAAIITERNGAPSVRQVPDPQAVSGALKIRVSHAGLQPTDLLRARGTYKTPEVPYIIGGEGVGRLGDGTRVYFGHSIPSSGAIGEWTIVPEREVWPIDESIAADQAVALGISGIGALIPLEEAGIRPGERVLILGATGAVGQVALLAARALGAGVVVAAARTAAVLERLEQRGLADAIAVLGRGDDVGALKAVAGPGFDVVLDLVYGPPAEAALLATRDGARMASIGIQAGETMTISLRALVRRTHIGVSTGHRPPAERHAAYERLRAYAARHDWHIDTVDHRLSDIGAAWSALQGSPGGKIVVRID